MIKNEWSVWSRGNVKSSLVTTGKNLKKLKVASEYRVVRVPKTKNLFAHYKLMFR